MPEVCRTMIRCPKCWGTMLQDQEHQLACLQCGWYKRVEPPPPFMEVVGL